MVRAIAKLYDDCLTLYGKTYTISVILKAKFSIIMLKWGILTSCTTVVEKK